MDFVIMRVDDTIKYDEEGNENDQGDDLGPGTLDDLDDLDLVSYPTR